MASLRSLEPAVEGLARAFVRALERRGIRVTVTSTRRSIDEQTALYNRYRAGLTRYPVAPPGKSSHGRGIAFDLQLDGLSPGAVPGYRSPWQYQLAGRIWKALGFTWGGDFNDPIHFDIRRA